MAGDAHHGATPQAALITELGERRAASIDQEARLRAALRDVAALLAEHDRSSVGRR